MIAYKGFTKELTARLGQGVYQFHIGQTEEEKEAKCIKNGFHCTEEPFGVLDWYSGDTDRYCIVKAEGDVNEDGTGRIACTKLTLVKEIDRKKLALHECHYLAKNPQREYSKWVEKEKGTADDYFAVVRGKHPIARGKKGVLLLLVREEAGSVEIAEIVALEVDGKNIKSNIYYGIDGKEVKDEKE